MQAPILAHCVTARGPRLQRLAVGGAHEVADASVMVVEVLLLVVEVVAVVALMGTRVCGGCAGTATTRTTQWRMGCQ